MQTATGSESCSSNVRSKSTSDGECLTLSAAPHPDAVPSPGVVQMLKGYVAGASPVPARMWQGCAQSRCRCGRDAPSPGADVAGVNPVPVQMWQGCAQSIRVQIWWGCVQSRRSCGGLGAIRSGRPERRSVEND